MGTQPEVYMSSQKADVDSKNNNSTIYPSLVFNMVAHFVVALFTGFIIYTAQPGSSLFSWHPTLMVLAFTFLMVEGILVFSKESSLIQKAARPTKVNTHTVCMVLSLLCCLGGAFVIWYNKELNGKPHVISWHGIIGYITVTYVGIQCLAGIFVKYHKILANYIKPFQLKMNHATSGLFLYSMVCLSMVLGMYSNWFTANVTGTSWYACFACPSILILVVMNQITTNYLGNRRIGGTTSTRVAQK